MSKGTLIRKASFVIVVTSLSLLVLNLSNLYPVFGNGLPANNTASSFNAQQPNSQSFAPAQQQAVPPLDQTSPETFQSQQQQPPPSTQPSGSSNGNFNNQQVTAQPPAQPIQPTASPATIVPQQGPPANFAARGTINSLIFVPQTKWIATGNWSMDVDNGNLTAFYTNMSWFDEKGTATHTHEFQNFRPSAEFMTVSLGPNNTIALQGLMDVGTNKKVVWKDVPTLINIKGGKTISISVDDSATNKHFAAQPILGVASSLASGLDVSVIPAEESVNSGDQQKVNVTVSDSTSNKKIEGARITGVIIDAFPGAEDIIDMNSTEPITTSEVDGQKFSGETDSNGQFSTTQRISDSKRPGTFTIVVTVEADGYDPLSKIVPFEVERESD